MAIIQTISTASQFRDEFRRYGRREQFSYEGLGILFDYLDDMDVDIELDVIELCCEYAEESWQSIAKDYRLELDETENEEYKIAQVRQYLQDEGAYIGETACDFVYRQF